MIKALLKWSFTWILASIPLLFSITRQQLEFGHLIPIDLCLTGEIFLVCIVMIAEPLGSLIFSRNSNNFCYFTSIVILVCIINFGHIYTLLEFAREHNTKYHFAENVQVDSTEAKRIYLLSCKPETLTQDIDSNKIKKAKEVYDSLLCCTIIAPCKNNGFCINNKGGHDRIIKVSKYSLISCLFMGFCAVIISHDGDEDDDDSNGDNDNSPLINLWRYIKSIFKFKSKNKD